MIETKRAADNMQLNAAAGSTAMHKAYAEEHNDGQEDACNTLDLPVELAPASPDSAPSHATTASTS